VPSPTLLIVVAALIAAAEAGMRALDAYASTQETWLPGWRAVRVGRRERSPYREGTSRTWVLAAKPGIPYATSIFLPPAFGILLLWGLATVLAVGDLVEVVRGARALPFVLASLSLCAIRAITVGAALLAAWDRRPRLFFLAAAIALAHDVALARYPLPCSDIRADDIRMALASGAAQAALTLGFAVSLLRRRGLVASARPPLPRDG
jgi:hypothetical protein